MKGCPLEYQRHGSPREVAPEDGKRLYLNEGLVFAIFGMEMCGTVVSKVHSNHNPKESSYVDRKSTRLNSSHANISYGVFWLKKKRQSRPDNRPNRLLESIRREKQIDSHR